MQRSSLTRTDDPTVRAEWTRRLAAGPWLWPVRSAPEFESALSLVPGGPPALATGDTAIVSVSDDRSTVALWKLRAHPTGARTAGAVGFTPEVEQYWRDVVSWIPRLVPVLWQPVAGIARLEIEAVRLAGWPAHGGREIDEHVLHGRSFGLAFGLAAASLLFGRRLKADFVASAEMRDGQVAPVGDIDLKVRGLATLAPAVRRVFVHADDVEEAERAANGTLRVVAVATFGEALAKAFGRSVESMFIQTGRDATSRAALVGRFFSLATSPRTSLVDWTPVRAAARLALDRWTLSRRERQMLQMAAAFAERHETNGGRLTLPDRRWLAALPRPFRLDVLAHLVSQVKYAASPTPARTVALARREAVSDLREASVKDLRLLGALARLGAVTGDPRGSLHQQFRLADQFFAIEEFGEVSYQLSECYRLAGALGDARAFERTMALEARAEAVDALRGGGQAFVDFAKGQALVCLGRGKDAEAALVRIVDAPLQAAHLRWSAMRWLMKVGRASGHGTEEWERRLREAAASDGPHVQSAPFYLALSELDAAISTGDRVAAAQALATMRALESGVIGHLERAARRLKVDAASYVATFYPD